MQVYSSQYKQNPKIHRGPQPPELQLFSESGLLAKNAR